MTGNKPLDGCCVLVVEDDFYLAEDLADTLHDAGAVVLGPFPNVRAALAGLRDASPDLAVLDVNLGGETSFEIGRNLKGRQIPLLFATGYDDSVIPADLADQAYLIKPLSREKLIAALIQARS